MTDPFVRSQEWSERMWVLAPKFLDKAIREWAPKNPNHAFEIALRRHGLEKAKAPAWPWENHFLLAFLGVLPEMEWGANGKELHQTIEDYFEKQSLVECLEENGILLETPLVEKIWRRFAAMVCQRDPHGAKEEKRLIRDVLEEYRE